MSELDRGDLLPEIVIDPPGPRSLKLNAALARHEAPGINTLAFGPALVWQEACGANVLDVDGNRFLDLTSGFGAAAVGHRHPAVVAAVRQQSAALLHGLGDVAAHPSRVRLAARLAAIAPVPDAQVYFAVSGSDAVEIALKTSILATGKSGVIAFDPAYHGLTAGALAVTSRRHFREPFASMLNAGVRRLPFGCALAELEAALGSGAVGCAIVEPIVGREGVLLPPPGWLESVGAACRAAGAVFIVDEILTGFGRTGAWFAVNHESVRPDLLCCGKALGGGMPIAAVLGRRDLMAAWPADGEAAHTATFVAAPTACAASLAVLDLLDREDLPARAARLGARLGDQMCDWTRRDHVVAARGKGLLWALQLSSPAQAAAVASGALARGLLVLAGGANGDVIEVLPPLTITRAQLDEALHLLAEAVAEAA